MNLIDRTALALSTVGMCLIAISLGMASIKIPGYTFVPAIPMVGGVIFILAAIVFYLSGGDHI